MMMACLIVRRGAVLGADIRVRNSDKQRAAKTTPATIGVMLRFWNKIIGILIIIWRGERT